MQTKRLYYITRDLMTRATVLETGHDDNGTWFVPDQTVAHVKGGGQKGDRGSVNGIAFRDVIARDGRGGAAQHYLEGAAAFAAGSEVDIVVDAKWRGRQASLHNGGHLVAALVEQHFPALRAVSAHHYEGEARVECVGDPPPDLGTIQATLNPALVRAIANGLPVRIAGDPFSTRAIQIGKYTPVPCGGTHPNSTGALVEIRITGVKNKDGKLRISYELAPETGDWE
jgi:Ser-tRNA(Ala) deacylase AlaX